MAKNTGNSGFRQLDVDAYSEDRYNEEEEAETPSALGPDEQEIANLLQANRNFEALRAALRHTPIKAKNQAVKNRASLAMSGILTAFKSAEIEQAVKQLRPDELDLLMKYVYKCFQLAADGGEVANGCAYYMIWHDKIFELAGHGSIVRVLTDRRRL